MADSTVIDATKMKVVDLRKELKTRGLSYAGDKAELVARLQAAISHDDHADINLDSDETEFESALVYEDDKISSDVLDDAAVDAINEELALADSSPPPKAPDTKHRALKRKITLSEMDKASESKCGDSKDIGFKKIVLNRAASIPSAAAKQEAEFSDDNLQNNTLPDSNKVRITANIDHPKTRLEMRAKRFGLPVQMSDAQRKEARKQRFGQTVSGAISAPLTGASLSDNLDILKKRAERFGQSVSKIMTDIENKEKLEKRKAKFGTAH